MLTKVMGLELGPYKVILHLGKSISIRVVSEPHNRRAWLNGSLPPIMCSQLYIICDITCTCAV